MADRNYSRLRGKVSHRHTSRPISQTPYDRPAIPMSNTREPVSPLAEPQPSLIHRVGTTVRSIFVPSWLSSTEDDESEHKHSLSLSSPLRVNGRDSHLNNGNHTHSSEEEADLSLDVVTTSRFTSQPNGGVSLFTPQSEDITECEQRELASTPSLLSLTEAEQSHTAFSDSLRQKISINLSNSDKLSNSIFYPGATKYLGNGGSFKSSNSFPIKPVERSHLPARFSQKRTSRDANLSQNASKIMAKLNSPLRHSEIAKVHRSNTKVFSSRIVNSSTINECALAINQGEVSMDVLDGSNQSILNDSKLNDTSQSIRPPPMFNNLPVVVPAVPTWLNSLNHSTGTGKPIKGSIISNSNNESFSKDNTKSNETRGDSSVSPNDEDAFTFTFAKPIQRNVSFEDASSSKT